MESHIFLGCWKCFFFAGKMPWEFDLADEVNTLRMLRRARLELRFRRSAAPVLLEAALGPLPRGQPPRAGRLMGELSRNFALVKMREDRGSSTIFFSSWAVQLRGCTLPENERNAPSWRLRKWCSSANGWNMKCQFPAVHFLGGAPSLKLTTIAPANWMVGKMKNMFAFGAQTPTELLLVLGSVRGLTWRLSNESNQKDVPIDFFMPFITA